MITSKQLVSWVGLTYRQCDYWTRIGYLRANEGVGLGSGHRRTFQTGEVAIACLLITLSRCDMLGVSGTGRQSDYLVALTERVREHGLVGTWSIGDGAVTISLDAIARHFADVLPSRAVRVPAEARG